MPAITAIINNTTNITANHLAIVYETPDINPNPNIPATIELLKILLPKLTSLLRLLCSFYFFLPYIKEFIVYISVLYDSKHLILKHKYKTSLISSQNQELLCRGKEAQLYHFCSLILCKFFEAVLFLPCPCKNS